MIRSSNVFTGRRCCLFLLLLLSLCTAAAATTLSGTFKNPDGSFVNGKIIFLLSQPARLNDQSAQIVPLVKIFSVTNGALETGAFVYGNDVLVPGGTYYLVRLVDTNNNLLFEQKWSISGVSLDLGTLTPTTTGVVYPDPLIKNLATGQAVQGPVSFSAPITAFSLTLNGNLNPGAADLYDLGNSSAPWKQLHAQRWNSLFAVGSSGGTALAPSTQPGTSVVLSGGSIADGTYYCKTTNWNQNGETTGSPTRTVTVAGGGGAAKINVGNADFFYMTGAPGFRVYCSNDNVTFYRQTPNPVVADFMIDSFTHYNSLGDAGSRLTSLTFSGTQIPTTNTATIDNLQVALNATRRAPTGTSPPVAEGTLFVPAIDGTVNPSGQFSLTTPLIAMKGDNIIGSGSASGLANYQTRIFDNNTWNNTKLGVVMVFGGDARIANLGLFSQSAGAALMVLGGAGYQAGTVAPMTVSDVILRNSKITTGYACYVAVGIVYDVFFHNVSFNSGFYAIEYRNIAGGEHYFSRGRWDVVEGIMRNVVGPTNPDEGINNPGFDNGLSQVYVGYVRTEGGSGILWDVMNLNVTLEHLEIADATVRAGTTTIFKMGKDGTYSGAPGDHLNLINTSPGAAGNAATGVLNGGATAIVLSLVGDANPGFGSSSGVNVGVNANNQSLFLTGMVTGSGNNFTVNPSPTTTGSVRAINVNNNSRIFYFGGGADLTSEPTWNEMVGRLVMVANAGNDTWPRNTRASFYNDGTSFKMLASDDTTVPFTFTHGGTLPGLLTLTSLRVGTNPAQVSTAAGDIGIRNSGGIWWRNAANSADLLGLYIAGANTLVINQPATTANQFASTLATGSPPFPVQSTTENTNFNAALLKGKTWAGPDPIGSTTPAAITGTTVAANTSATIGGGTAITKVISATATLDFSNTSASTCSDMTLTVTDAAAGDSVFLGAPSASVPVGGSFFAWVSAANTVTVRFCADGTARDPASGSFRATIVKF